MDAKRMAWQRIRDGFREATREDGTTFVKVIPTEEGGVDGLIEAVREAHDGAWPHDRIFATAREIAEGMAGYDDPNDDDLTEVLDGVPDAYNAARLAWLADAPSAAHAVDDAVTDYEWPGDLFTAIGYGWMRWAEGIAAPLVELADAIADEIEEEHGADENATDENAAR